MKFANETATKNTTYAISITESHHMRYQISVNEFIIYTFRKSTSLALHV